MMFAPDAAAAPGDVLAVPGAESFEQLVTQVKEMQRRDVNAREQWGNYVALSGTKDRDPAKRDPAFLQNFLIQMQSGVKFQTLDDTSGAALVQAVRVLQKKSSVFKTVWTTYNSQHGKGFNDPTKHDSAYHIRFFDTMAQQACIAMGAMDPNALMMTGGEGENPMKRMRDSSGMGLATAGYGGGAKDHWVNQVKNFQRLGPDQNELWGVYADTYLQGIRDPSRHDAATLQEFCVNHNVPPVDAVPQQVGVAIPPPAIANHGSAYGAAMPPDHMQFAGMPPPGAYPGMAPAMPVGMPATVGLPAGGMMGGPMQYAGGMNSAGGGMPDTMTPGMF